MFVGAGIGEKCGMCDRELKKIAFGSGCAFCVVISDRNGPT
jgi:hypothetical protein